MNCVDDIDKIADEIIELYKLDNEIDDLVKKYLKLKYFPLDPINNNSNINDNIYYSNNNIDPLGHCCLIL